MSTSGPLSGKVALITGASKGIGRAIALRLAADGASVVVNYSRDPAPAEEVVKTVGVDRAIAIRADAGKVEECRALVQKTMEIFGRLDFVVANAGILDMKTLEQTTESDWDKFFAVNVKGPYFLCQEAVKHISPGGRIVFFSSTVTVAPTITSGYLLYASTKGAIEQMTRMISRDLAPRGINVNCVSPGPVATELFFKGKPPALVEAINKQSPAGRIGEPDEIAGVVRFLVSEDAGWVNGQNIRVNGGLA